MKSVQTNLNLRNSLGDHYWRHDLLCKARLFAFRFVANIYRAELTIKLFQAATQPAALPVVSGPPVPRKNRFARQWQLLNLNTVIAQCVSRLPKNLLAMLNIDALFIE